MSPRPCRRGQQLGDALLVEGVFVQDSEAGGVIFEDRAIGLLVAGSRSEHYLWVTVRPTGLK